MGRHILHLYALADFAAVDPAPVDARTLGRLRFDLRALQRQASGWLLAEVTNCRGPAILFADAAILDRQDVAVFGRLLGSTSDVDVAAPILELKWPLGGLGKVAWFIYCSCGRLAPRRGHRRIGLLENIEQLFAAVSPHCRRRRPSAWYRHRPCSSRPRKARPDRPARLGRRLEELRQRFSGPRPR